MFRHEALLYEGDDGFLDGTVPFVRDAVAERAPVMVAVAPERIERMRTLLGDAAAAVTFADMTALGANPGRIIPAWHAFLEEHSRAPAVRGIGEPIWPGRTSAELVECQLHEALLNLAFAGTDGFHLRCPYDTTALEPHVIHEAGCSHPALVDAGGSRPSRDFRGGDELLARFDVPLPRPRAEAQTFGFDLAGLDGLRRAISERASRAGLPAERAQDLVLAANELATNSIRHGGGQGVARVWEEDATLKCEIADRGLITDPLAGRRTPEPGQNGGWGLWIAQLTCDLVQLRTGPHGTHIRLHVRLP